MRKNSLSKKLNRRILFASLIYTIFFLILFLTPTFSSVIKEKQEKQLSEVLLNSIYSILFFFFWMYLLSGVQILILGFILKYYYRKNLKELVKLSTLSSKVIVIILSVIWFILNLIIWSGINTLKLG